MFVSKNEDTDGTDKGLQASVNHDDGQIPARCGLQEKHGRELVALAGRCRHAVELRCLDAQDPTTAPEKQLFSHWAN